MKLFFDYRRRRRRRRRWYCLLDDELVDVPETLWQKLMDKIDEQQFRENWSQEELAEVKMIASKIKDLGVKRGI